MPFPKSKHKEDQGEAQGQTVGEKDPINELWERVDDLRIRLDSANDKIANLEKELLEVYRAFYNA